MNNFFVRIMAGLALIALVSVSAFGATIWEGAATVAAPGDFPVGFYMSAKSLQRNTVAEVTNLENSNTIRVMVASTLESSGVLAVLSADAAAALGISSNSTARIRITSLPDAEAFSPFTSALNATQAEAEISAESNEINETVAAIEQTAQASEPAPLSAAPVSDMEIIQSLDLKTTAEAPTTGSGLESAAPALAVTTPALETAAQPAPVSTPAVPAPLPTTTASAAAPPATVPAPSPWAAAPAVETPPLIQIAPIISGPQIAAAAPVPTTAASTPITPVSVDVAKENLASIPQIAPLGRETTSSGGGALTLVPAEERPPVSDTASTESVSTSAAPQSFSVKTVQTLDAGAFYLQMGAYRYPTMVESELDRIGRDYPLLVEQSGSGDAPLYRILIGPMSEGEAGALFQQFRRNGFPDAFIRR
jgi:hypothetical protein